MVIHLAQKGDFKMRRNELYFNLVEKIFENGQKKNFMRLQKKQSLS